MLESRCSVVELRQYTLHPGRRDELIALFEREFIEPQEAEGISLIGLFRDLDKPDRFVWIRGFPSMAQRAKALGAFYGGETWRAHRDAANDTMIDSDNVFMLRPAGSNGAAATAEQEAPAAGGVFVASIYAISPENEAAVLALLEHSIKPALAESGGPLLASFVTETSENNFPALPVREGEHVVVTLARFDDLIAYERHLDERAASPAAHRASQELAAFLSAPIETLRLSPTSRSRLQ